MEKKKMYNNIVVKTKQKKVWQQPHIAVKMQRTLGHQAKGGKPPQALLIPFAGATLCRR